MMITINDIQSATDTIELQSMIDEASDYAGIDLEHSSSYAESAKHVRNLDDQFANILDAAENKWFDLES